MRYLWLLLLAGCGPSFTTHTIDTNGLPLAPGMCATAHIVVQCYSDKHLDIEELHVEPASCDVIPAPFRPKED